MLSASTVIDVAASISSLCQMIFCVGASRRKAVITNHDVTAEYDVQGDRDADANDDAGAGLDPCIHCIVDTIHRGSSYLISRKKKMLKSYFSERMLADFAVGVIAIPQPAFGRDGCAIYAKKTLAAGLSARHGPQAQWRSSRRSGSS